MATPFVLATIGAHWREAGVVADVRADVAGACPALAVGTATADGLHRILDPFGGGAVALRQAPGARGLERAAGVCVDDRRGRETVTRL